MDLFAISALPAMLLLGIWLGIRLSEPVAEDARRWRDLYHAEKQRAWEAACRAGIERENRAWLWGRVREVSHN